MKGFTMKLTNIEKAFEIERQSYLNTINLLMGQIEMLRTGKNETIEDLKEATIDELDGKLKAALGAIEELTRENARLSSELDNCGKKLNAQQYKEYKRLKQNEYQRRWYKKSRTKNNK